MVVDQRIIKGCIAKDRQAQKELYQALLPYLRAVAHRYLRNTSYEKDALQESFLKIFKSIGKYDPAKAPIKSWASRIVINTCLNYNERVIGVTTDELVVERHQGLAAPVRVEELSDDRLLSIVKRMPKGYFEVFNLFVVEGYNHREIATLLRISEAVSRKKLSRARTWLQNSKSTLLNF